MNKLSLQEWIDAVSNIHLPRWEELPELDLYMDQVVTLLDRYLGFLLPNDQDRIVTPAMINNYVKLNLIPKPKKKQYSKKHLAYLVAITVLKQVLTIKEIKEGILYQANVDGIKESYNLFCVEQEFAFKQVCGLIEGQLELIQDEKIEQQSKLAMKMATRAFASKILASYIVNSLETENND